MAQTPNVKVDLLLSLERMRRSAALFTVAMEAVGEMQAEDEKWGIQRHRDGTGKGYGNDMLVDLDRFGMDTAANPADVARDRANHYAGLNNGDALEWEQILTEEFFEALEESDPAKLRTELLQVAAVALNWVTDIDSREPELDEDES
jgi:hypothetical protein